MTTKKIAREKRDWTANWRLLPGLACLALLAGCGGGGSGSDTATAQDATKQIAAAVPGSWTGRVPGSEVINGITVPPEPSPTLNNATLAGVDANKNGVRDDVERVIANAVTGAQQFDKVIIFAKSYQSFIVNPSPTNRDEALVAERSFLCSSPEYSDIPTTLRSASESSIQTLTFNTDQRKEKLVEMRKIVGGFDSSEVSCE